MVFVDTGAWFALFIPRDRHYTAARRWLDANTEVLVTTDYVIDETLTLIRAKFGPTLSISVGRQIQTPNFCQIEHVEPGDFDTAWRVFSQFDDKAWSFTDCVSRVVMGRLEITTAFAFDEHFRQFGTVSVVP